MEVQECPVFELEWSRTHRQKFSKPFTVTLPKGEVQISSAVSFETGALNSVSAMTNSFKEHAQLCSGTSSFSCEIFGYELVDHRDFDFQEGTVEVCGQFVCGISFLTHSH